MMTLVLAMVLALCGSTVITTVMPSGYAMIALCFFWGVASYYIVYNIRGGR